jgi:hypothetical protein
MTASTPITATATLPLTLLPCAIGRIPDIELQELSEVERDDVIFPVTLRGHQWFADNYPGQAFITLRGEDIDTSIEEGEGDPLNALIDRIYADGLVIGHI